MSSINLNSLINLFLPMLCVIILLLSVKQIKENQRIAIFRFKKFLGIKGPKLVIVWPVIDNSRILSIGDTAELADHNLIHFNGMQIPVRSRNNIKTGDIVKIDRFNRTTEGWSTIEVSKINT